MNVTNKGSTSKAKQGSHKPHKKLSSAGIGSWGGGQTTGGGMKAAGGGIGSFVCGCDKTPTKKQRQGLFGSQFGAQSIVTGKAAETGGSWPQGILSQEAETNAGAQLAFCFPAVGAPAGGMVAAIQGRSSQLQK